MERRRRQRINDCLNQLKSMLETLTHKQVTGYSLLILLPNDQSSVLNIIHDLYIMQNYVHNYFYKCQYKLSYFYIYIFYVSTIIGELKMNIKKGYGFNSISQF